MLHTVAMESALAAKNIETELIKADEKKHQINLKLKKLESKKD